MNKKAIIAELSVAAKTYKPVQRPWSPDELEILCMFYGKVPLQQLADRLGRTLMAIQQKAAGNRKLINSDNA